MQHMPGQHTLVADFVQQIDHNINLVDSSVVEVLPHCHGELFLRHLPL